MIQSLKHIMCMDFVKSKVLYSLLLNKITANIPSTTKFLRQYCARPTDDVSYIFTKKSFVRKRD